MSSAEPQRYRSTMDRNPLDEILDEKEKQAVDRKVREVGLWQTWNQNGRKPEHLEPLLKAYQPLVNQRAKEWKPPAIPQSAFKAELQNHLIKALETYNPERAALSTHIGVRLQKAKRYMTQHANVAYIPEAQVSYIGKIQRATDKLTEDLGRAPTHNEIADHVGLPLKRVSTIIGAMRKDIPASAFGENDPMQKATAREREVLDLLQFNLSSDEKQVFNHLYGREGQPTITSTNELAQRLGKSPSQISRLKTSILGKYKKYA
jgi:DNA-directed RNA polymerase specialized sigma subunit